MNIAHNKFHRAWSMNWFTRCLLGSFVLLFALRFCYDVLFQVPPPVLVSKSLIERHQQRRDPDIVVATHLQSAVVMDDDPTTSAPRRVFGSAGHHIDSTACRALRATQTSDSYLTHAIGTKLLYVRNAKCSSKSIQASLEKRFGTRVWNDKVTPIPDDFFLFTFVRNPMDMAVSAYGEIVKNYVPFQRGHSPRPTFVDMLAQLTEIGDDDEDKKAQHLNSTFHRYLDELFSGRLGPNTETNYYPGHGYPSAVRLAPYLHRINFIGKMEDINEGWRQLQQLANITKVQDMYTPQHRRLLAPSSSSTTRKNKAQSPHYPPTQDMRSPYGVDLSDMATRCAIFRYYVADFVCFGYNYSHYFEQCF